MATAAQQAKTAFQLRSDRFESFEVTATGDWTAGDIILVEDTVGINATDVATGETAVIVYWCPKVVVPKQTGTGRDLAVGQKVLGDADNNRVSDADGAGTIIVGFALEPAGEDDETVLIHLDTGTTFDLGGE